MVTHVVTEPRPSGSGRHLLPLARKLLALEDKRDGLALRPNDVHQHGLIRGKGVAFERNRAGLRGRHPQNAVIPPGFGLEIFAGANRGVVLAAGAVVVEEGLCGAFIGKTPGDDDDALPVADGHSSGLNDGLAGKIALGGYGDSARAASTCCFNF